MQVNFGRCKRQHSCIFFLNYWTLFICFTWVWTAVCTFLLLDTCYIVIFFLMAEIDLLYFAWSFASVTWDLLSRQFFPLALLKHLSSMLKKRAKWSEDHQGVLIIVFHIASWFISLQFSYNHGRDFLFVY